VGDRWHSPGLETRGWHPIDGTRTVPRWIVVMMDSAIRRQMSKNVWHGNAWSGWLENGNPHGEPRPGPIAVPRGILAALSDS